MLFGWRESSVIGSYDEDESVGHEEPKDVVIQKGRRREVEDIKDTKVDEKGEYRSKERKALWFMGIMVFIRKFVVFHHEIFF